jgi:acyl-CoA synthetase (NDP forming)
MARDAASLIPLFRPRSVAVVGASSDPNKVGGRPLAFLRKGGYAGRLFAVNPTAREVQGVVSHASLQAIGEPLDQVIVAVPPAQVMGVAAQCAALKVGALQIFSAGFGDGVGAAQVQADLALLARNADMRVLGPNSLGLFNVADGFFGTFATALDGAWPQAGGIGVATQSGAFGSYFFGLAQLRGLGISHFVATGNEADVDVADCVSFMVEDPATKLIVIALEGCRDGRKLARALHAAHAAGKPVFAMKVGVSSAGAQAAATHTGSLSGEDRVFDAVLRDAGAFRAASLQQLVDAAYVAAAGALPDGREMLVVTTSGGIGVLTADAADAAGMNLPPLTDAAHADIQRLVPLADGHNPVDTSAAILGDLSAYARIAGRAMADRHWPAVLCYLAHITRNPAHWAQLREPLLALRQRHPQTCFVAVCLADAAITADLQAHGIAVFCDPTQAVQAIAACVPGVALPWREPADGAGAPELLGPLDTEHAAKQALAAAGLQFVPERLVTDAGTALAAAREFGFPVVLKVVSPDIAHKTEAGGVQLDIADDAALVDAVTQMRRRVAANRPGARIEGFLIAPQLSGGVEVLAGTQTDPVFGPVLTVGAGGVLTELVQDVCVRLAPVDEAGALQMLRSMRLARLLDGFRGARPVDLPALARQLALLSEVAWSNRALVYAIELNPIVARPEGVCAVDALIVRTGATP